MCWDLVRRHSSVDLADKTFAVQTSGQTFRADLIFFTAYGTERPLIFRKWTRRVTLSLCLDGHPWEVWIHLQGSSDLNGEILSRHQKWGPMLGYSRKSLGLYELQVENHQTLTWETYSSHCITSYVLLSNNHDSMCTLVSPEKVIKTAFKICQKLFSGEFSSTKEILLSFDCFIPIKFCLNSPKQSPITNFFFRLCPQNVSEYPHKVEIRGMAQLFLRYIHSKIYFSLIYSHIKCFH